MYGLTDNIVAGPAGHTEAGPAGHFEAGPVGGGFTPAGAGQTTPAGAGQVTPAGAGWVPIANAPAEIPYAPGGGGAVPGAGSATPGPVGGGTPQPGGSAIPGRAGGGDTLGGAILGALGGGGGSVPGAGGGATGLAGAGMIPGAGAGATPGGGGGLVPGGGGAVSGGGGGSIPGGGGGAAGGTSGGGSTPGGGASASGAFSGGGAPGGAGSSAGGAIGGGSGVVYSVSSGGGAAPAERAGGILLSQPSGGGLPGEGGSIGFVLGPPGRSVSAPTGYVHPPMAAHFHGHATPHVAHQPTEVFQHTVTSEAWKGYQAAYVWPGPPEILPFLDMLPSGHVDPSTYQTPHVLFNDEKPGPKSTVDATVGAARMQVTEAQSQTTNQDFSQQRTVQNQTVAIDKSDVTLDNSSTNDITIALPQQHEVTMNIDDSRTVNVDSSSTTQRVTNLETEEAARVVNMLFLEDQAAPAALNMGAPITSRKA